MAHWVRLGIVAALFAPACDTSVERAGSRTRTSAARAVESPARAAGRAAFAPAPPSGVYFLLAGRGLTALENGQLRRVGDADAYFEHAVARRGGGLWLEHAEGIALYRGGDSVERIPDSAGLAPVVETADGLWATGADDVALWNGKTWARTPTEELGAMHHEVVGLAAGNDGAVYALAGQRLHRWRAGVWQSFSVPPDATDMPNRVVVAGDRVFVLGAEQVFHLEGDTLVASAPLADPVMPTRVVGAADGTLLLPSSDLLRFDGKALTVVEGAELAPRLEASPDGAVWAVDMQWQAVVRIDRSGAITRVPAVGELELSIDRVLGDPMAVDGGGRLWLVTQFGVAYVDGGTVVNWTVGTSPALPARVREIVVVGDGTVDVPDLGPPRLITITGTLIDDGKQPLAGIALELCPEYCLESPGESPCEGQPFVRRAESAADGSFTLAGAPPGKVPVWYQRPGSTSWEAAPIDDCCDVDGAARELAAGTLVLH